MLNNSKTAVKNHFQVKYLLTLYLLYSPYRTNNKLTTNFKKRTAKHDCGVIVYPTILKQG